MKFRTPVETSASAVKVCHSDAPLFVGSCFSAHIAERLRRDGFDVVSNPGGALYNPASIASFLHRALRLDYFREEELVEGPRGYHLTALSTVFSGAEGEAVISAANSALESAARRIAEGAVFFVTLGTAFVFEWKASGCVVGNCHKLPATCFTRRRMSVDECVGVLAPVVRDLSARGVHTVFTVSPVRHTADTLHGNTLSKSTLHLACDALLGMFPGACSYFPAYEAIIDDLRDYRFTASDMKHPTEQAADYVYELFTNCFFSEDTLKKALSARKASARAAHRPILDNG